MQANLHAAQRLFEHAAGERALRRAVGDDLDLDGHGLVERDAAEVHVEDFLAPGVELDLLHQRAFLPVAQAERDQPAPGLQGMAERVAGQ